MNIVDIISLKFPNEFNQHLIQIGDHGLGKGPEIVVWPDFLPPYTHENLMLWEIEINSQWKEHQFQTVNSIVLQQLEDLDLKSIRALRANDLNKLDELEKQAVKLRQQIIRIN